MDPSPQPAAAMTVVSMLGGVLAYTRTGSVPSILASFTIGGALAMSSMRIKDGLDYGIEGAALSSAALAVPTLRAIRVRAPIPAVISLLALSSTAYYTKSALDRQSK